MTNEALLGYAFDEATGPVDLLRAHVGRLAQAGDPRAWCDSELSRVQNVARMFAREPANAVEWYYPRRLTLDALAAGPLELNATTRLLGLRLLHRREIDLPLYAFASGAAPGRIITAARAFIARSRSPAGKAVLVTDKRMDHLDPLVARPGRNSMVRTLVPFLRSLG